MCSMSDFISEIQRRLKDVAVHLAELRSMEVEENGSLKAYQVLVSTSGKVYRLAEKVDDVQKGAGVVRKAYQLKDGSQSIDYERPLAAKIYPLQSLRSNRLGDDFIQEIVVHHAVSKMAADNFVEGVVPFLECLFTADSLMIFMPFYNKKDLFYYLTQNSGLLPVEVVKSIFRRVVSAVAMLHDCGYIHRDISCENIYFHAKNDQQQASESLNKKLKRELNNSFDLGDFGMSAPLESTSSLSQELGKPSYKSPELNAKKLQTPEDWQANDVWALGVVLYLMLMKAFPFNQAKQHDQLFLDRIVHRRIASRARVELSRSCYSAYNKDLEERLQGIELVQTILALKPGDRPSAAAIRDHPWLRMDLFQFTKTDNICSVFCSPMEAIRNQFILLLDDASNQDQRLDTGQSCSATTSTPQAAATSAVSNSTFEAA